MKLKIFSLVFISSLLFSQVAQFEKVTLEPITNDGGDSRAVNWIDYDSDGDLDLMITNGPRSGQNNFLYSNNGDGTFTKVTGLDAVNDGLASDGSSWGDYDNDGRPDLFVGNWWNQTNLLYNGSGELKLQSNSIVTSDRSYSETGSWGDYNNDGFLDLYVTNSGGTSKVNFLFENNGDGRFTKITESAHVTDAFTSRNIDWIDYDGDGDLDIFVTNEGNEANNLYRNNGDQGFEKISDHTLVNSNKQSFGSSWGDYDNDGLLDLFISNWQNQNNQLYKNLGNGNYEEVTSGIVVEDGGYSVGSAWGDVDNDGDLDLFVANAFSGNSQTLNLLYINNGNGTFKKDTSEISKEPGWTYGTAFGDYNNDGYLDIALGKCFNANENNAIYRNKGGDNNWLKINLEGSVSNRSAIGTLIKLYDNSGNIKTRRVSGQSGYCGQNLQQHFGLSNLMVVDSIVAYWPSGDVGRLVNTPVNQTLNIKETKLTGYLMPNFKADTLTGGTSLSVQFTDLTVVDDASPVSSWQWDFNNDGTVDSEERNPLYIFTSDTLTQFSVKLTVSNGTEQKSFIRENYITMTGLLPDIQFNDGRIVLGTYTSDLQRVDTSFFVYNNGTASDSITIIIDYRRLAETDAFIVEPLSFRVDPSDSVEVFLTLLPELVTPKSSLYSINLDIYSDFYGEEFLKQIRASFRVVVATSVDDIKNPATEFSLSQNYPNPFNPTTTIEYSIPKSLNPQNGYQYVTLKIYDTLGREVATLINDAQTTGNYSAQWDASDYSSGLYIYKLTYGTQQITKQMLLIK